MKKNIIKKIAWSVLYMIASIGCALIYGRMLTAFDDTK